MSSTQQAFEIFTSAVESVQPNNVLAQHIQCVNHELWINGAIVPMEPQNKIFVIGAGKASAAMAVEVERILGNKIYKGIITTKYHHQLSLTKIKCIKAAHPVPDEQSVLAVQETIDLLNEAQSNDIVICLISGGASSLWLDVPQGIQLKELQILFQQLLNCGANIHEMNCIRKHVSVIKGGQILRFAPHAKWFSFLISDVPNDDVSVIASGLTVADTSTFKDAWNIILKYHLQEVIPHSINEHLQKGLNGAIEETIKPNNPILNNSFYKIIASNPIALAAATKKAETLGFQTVFWKMNVDDDASHVAKELIQFSLSFSPKNKTCILVGGETTVVVNGKGKGGRNQHLVLSALIEWMNHSNFSNKKITLLSAGTDGTDGPTDAAGAIITNAIFNRVNDLQLNAIEYFNKNDSYTFFEQLNALVKTGATQTNVMDIIIVLIEP